MSDREKMLGLLASGLSRKEVAAKLGCSKTKVVYWIKWKPSKKLKVVELGLKTFKDRKTAVSQSWRIHSGLYHGLQGEMVLRAIADPGKYRFAVVHNGFDSHWLYRKAL